MGLLLGASTAQAEVILNAVETANRDVVISGGGTLNLDAWLKSSTAYYRPVIAPATAGVMVGIGNAEVGGYAETYVYPSNYLGPPSFGDGIPRYADDFEGDLFGSDPSGPYLFVPDGHPTGDPLSGSATYYNTTFDELGMEVGTYVWRWGSGSTADSFTLNVGVGGPEPVTIGGSVFGLVGSGLVLQNNSSDDLSRDADGPFVFDTPLTPSFDSYDVTVFTQPEGQTCRVLNGSGPVPNDDVTNIAVACGDEPDPVTIGGVVSGLEGSGLVLQNNSGDDLPIGGDGPFTFDTPLTPGYFYDVTVFTQPEGQFCSVENGSGQVPADDVTNVSVACGDEESETVSVGGSVFGLEIGSILLLRNLYIDEDGFQIRDYLLRFDNGPYVFNDELPPNSAYNVNVLFSFPEQTCSVVNGSGNLFSEDITDVLVACGPAAESTIGGTVTGLEGSGLVLQNNITDIERIDADGDFTFNKPLPAGGTYNVTVLTNPTNPAQECFVAKGSGPVPFQDVTNVAVTCAPPDDGPPPPELGTVCARELCADNEDLQENCERFLVNCLLSEPFNQDECLGGALLICADGDLF
jgi:hypothetical protein